MKINSTLHDLAVKVSNNEISISRACGILYRAGYFNYFPSEGMVEELLNSTLKIYK